MSAAATRRLRRVAVFAAASLLLVLVAGALALRQAGEWARAAVESRLQAQLVPTLRIAEAVELSLFPQPAATLRGITLGDDTPDLRVDELQLRLEPAPLWRGEVEVAAVSVSGVELVLRRGADGWNLTRWLRPGDGTDEAVAPPPVERVTVEDARVRVEGEVAVEFADLRLAAGPFVPGRQGRVELSAQARARTPFAAAFDLEFVSGFALADGAVRLDAPRLDAQGELDRWRVTRGEAAAASAQWSPAAGPELEGLALRLEAAAEDGTIALDATLAQLAGDGSRWTGEALQAALRAKGAAGQWRAELAAMPRIDADGWTLAGLDLAVTRADPAQPLALGLTGALAGAGAGAPLRLAIDRGQLRLPHPTGHADPLEVDFSGRALLEPQARTARADIAGRFDDSRFDGTARFDPAAAPPLTLALKVDRLDLDRYRPPPAEEREAADLGAWRDWPVAAELAVGRLEVGGLTSRNARLRLEGAGSLKAGR